MVRKYLNVIGVMTGNSLDAVDAVLCRVSDDGSIQDIAFHSEKNPEKLTRALRDLRQAVKDCAGEVNSAEEYFNRAYKEQHGDIEAVHALYIHSIANCIKKLTDAASAAGESELTVDLVGIHGQTCAHYPPSLARKENKQGVYTVQFGNGQELSDILGIPVAYDFRSDDLMNGGEAAPLAPAHHARLAKAAEQKGYFPIAFCNGGNTGNVSVVSREAGSQKEVVLGWDTGPFNHFPDLLMRSEQNLPCDPDGKYGLPGKVVKGALRELFYCSALTPDKENFIEKAPPKSSDPEWYDLPAELLNKRMSFSNRLRTAEYFAAYAFFYNLTLIPQNIEVPSQLALCGGGWKNPVIKDHFLALLSGDLTFSPVLSEHVELFEAFRSRSKIQANLSSFYGFDENAMEARILVDAAVSRLKKEHFTSREITGINKPAVLGLIRFPKKDPSKATDELKDWIKRYDSLSLIQSEPKNPRWSRAVAGWKK